MKHKANFSVLYIIFFLVVLTIGNTQAEQLIMDGDKLLKFVHLHIESKDINYGNLFCIL